MDVEQGRCLRSCTPYGSASVLLFFVQLSVERRIVIRSRYLAIGGKQNYDFDELARTVEVEASSLKVLPTGASSWRMSIFLSRLDAHEGKSSHVGSWSNLIYIPLSLAKDLNMTFVHVRLLKPPRCVPSHGSRSVQPDGAEDAFQILMASNVAATSGGELWLPPELPENDGTRGPRKLHNAIMKMLKQDEAKSGVKLKTTAESEVAKFVTCLRDALWFADRRHRELRVPDCLSQLDKIMKTTHRSTKRSAISVNDVRTLANSLGDSTKFQFVASENWLDFMDNVRTLICGFRAYIKRGEEQRTRTANNTIATTTAKATQNKTHQQLRVVTN